jgi:hypothetical protein
LGLQAEVLLRHLARRQAQVVAVSLTAEGAGLGQQVLEEVFGDQEDVYINLGYLAGEAVGIRSLQITSRQFQETSFDGQPISESPILENRTDFSLSDLSLLLVFTGDGQVLRRWVEQTTALRRESGVDLPLVAGVSAAIEPLARPYYEMTSPQIDGLVVGLAGAVDYENALNQPDGPAHLRFGGQILGQVAVILVILVGMLYNGLVRKNGTKA